MNLFDPKVPRTYVLPDGQRIELGMSRFKAPELLFNPNVIGSEDDGIHKTLVYCKMSQKMILKNIEF